MADESKDQLHMPPDDRTIPSRSRIDAPPNGNGNSDAPTPPKRRASPRSPARPIIDEPTQQTPRAARTEMSASNQSRAGGIMTPWVLQQYYAGDINLDEELTLRNPQMPLMSLMHTRETGKQVRRAVAMLSTQDNAVSLLFEIDLATRATQLTATHSSFLSLRFAPRLGEKDRAQFVERLRREVNEPIFMWGAGRWEHDFVIGVAHKYFTNLYAMSPRGVEAAARLTPDVTKRLLDWLETNWSPAAKDTPKDIPPESLSW